MHNLDELEQAIRDRQVRYRHEAYRGRFGGHAVRGWLGDRLVTLGETVRGRPLEASVTAAERLSPGQTA